MVDTGNPWDAEYDRQGIPSSSRLAPSTSVRWFLEMIKFVRPDWQPRHGLDVGCGTGRNSYYLARRGIDVTGIDGSAVAIERAKSLACEAEGFVKFLNQELSDGLPVNSASVEVVVDAFVFFHMSRSDERDRYLHELDRVLAPGGLLLLTLAATADSYYASCPEVANWQEWSNIKLVEDPVARVRNAMFTEAELRDLFGGVVSPVMTWQKNMNNVMHSKNYEWSTLCTIWQKN